MKYDIAIIGGGPAGYTAGERAAENGLKTILFEKNAIGGVCLNEGCIPTKTLLYSAKILDSIKSASKYGIQADDNPGFDLGKIIARKNKTVKKLTLGVKAKLNGNGVTIVQGEALIRGEEEGYILIQCGEEVFAVKNILLCTGSETVIPPIKGLSDIAYWTSREALDIKELPRSVAIIGGGVIGMEFASFFNSMGVKVKVIEMMPEILGAMDKEISAMLRAEYTKKGVVFFLETKVIEVTSDSVIVEKDGKTETIEADKILVSVGRKANTANLGLETIGIELLRNGVKVNEYMQTSHPNVYACGDVTGFSMLALLLFGSFLALTAQAQTGVICGTVTDAKFKEPLIGATVSIEGTTMGAITDMDGNFRLENIQPGKYALIASYVSYQAKTIKDISVVARQETVVRIELSEADLQLEGVTVVGRKNMESENVLLLERKTASVSVENMGAKEMTIKGISNVADGVKKLTGISMVGTGQLFVRGLGDRYSLTTMNGLVVASPNPDNKLIPLDLFPASAVKNITVSKVYQASAFGDYAGAHIDVGTKENTGNDFFTVSFSAGGRTNAFLGDFYTSDKNRGIGVKNLSSSIKDMTGKEFGSFVKKNDPFGTSFNIRNKTTLPDMNVGLGFGKSWEWGSGKLSLLGSGGFKTDSEIQKDSYEAVLTAQGEKKSAFHSDDYNFQTQANGLLSLGYQFENADMINYSLLYSRMTEDIYKHRWGDTYDFTNLEGSNSIYHVYTLMNHQLAGTHSLGKKWKLNWKGAYGITSSDEPDRRQLMFRRSDNGELRLFTNDKNASSRFFGELDEKVGTGDLHLTYNLDDKNLIRFGGAYLNKKRDYYSTFFFYDFSRMPSSVVIDNVYEADKYVNADNFANGYYAISKSSEPKYSYNAKSEITAVFAESDFYPLGDRLLVNAGLRFEHARQTVDYWTDGGAGKVSELETNDFLPALNLKYNLTDEQAVRASFSRTVTRPQFIEMAPFDYQESFGGASVRGNEELKNGYDFNVDLRYEYITGSGDMFSVGGYYKYLDSPIERVQKISGGYIFHTFMNATKGHAAGLEAEIRKALTPAWRFGVNAAYMFTRVKLPEDGVYTDKERALQGASPFLGNADVTFTPQLGGKRNLSLVLLYNLQGPRIYTVGINKLGNVKEQTRHTLDFNARYALNDHWELKLQAKNLLNSTIRFKQEVTDTGKEEEVERYKTNTKVEVGVTYKF